MRYYYPFGTDTDLPGQFKVWRMITQKGSLLPASKNKETKKKLIDHITNYKGDAKEIFIGKSFCC